MTPKRKKTQDYILKYIDKIAPGGYNKGLYEDLFKKMNDKDFDEFMVRLKKDELTLSVITPVAGDVKLDVKRNLNIAKELGFSFFQKLDIGPKGSKADGTYIPKYRTSVPHLTYDITFRRTSQLLIKGVSIGADNSSIDLTTGQVTGDSKAAKLTKPEIEVLVGYGLKDSVVELMKVRGGDQGSAKAMEASIAQTGAYNLNAIEPYATGVVSTKTLKSYMAAAHIKTNLK